MKIKLVFFVIIILTCKLAKGQTVLLHEKINDNMFEVPKKGPNFRHFTHMYLGFAFYIPHEDRDEITTINGATTAFSIGIRYKYKINNFFAIGTGFNYTNDIFSIKQDKNKIFPNSVIHRKEKIRFNSIGPYAFIRFNFGKRGNIIGRFIDIGVYYNWVFSAKHVCRDKIDNQTNKFKAGKQKIVLSNLDYVRDFHYGIKSRIGINRLVLTASYRLDELLNDDYYPLFLPRLNIGVEIGLHK